VVGAGDGLVALEHVAANVSAVRSAVVSASCSNFRCYALSGDV
jgi:hypothetical protein